MSHPTPLATVLDLVPGPRRIGLVAPPWLPVPPSGYGGIEEVVALLAGGLVDAGHEVVLVAAPGSEVPGVSVHVPLSEAPDLIGGAHHERWHLLWSLDALADCDVVFDHCGPTGALAQSLPGGPPSYSVAHGPLDGEEGRAFACIARRNPALRLIAISQSQRDAAPGLPFAGVCHNGIDVDAVPFAAGGGDYLAFLGRMSPEKGAAQAIEIARDAGMPLRIAAKCREPAEIAYFERFVAPHIGPGVEWLGELGRADKYALLAGALALVFPIDWAEPFGMVMIEAMAAGTPVLATRRGAVPEVVVEGRTGFVRGSVAELVGAAHRLGEIDRAECRRHVGARFSREALAAGYLAHAPARGGRRAARSAPGP